MLVGKNLMPSDNTVGRAPQDQSRALHLRAGHVGLCAILVVACISTVSLLFHHADRYPQYPVDAYYYLEMARNLARGNGLSVRFEQGMPVKFFPGYPLLLGTGSLLGGPDFAWKWLQALFVCATGALMVVAIRRSGMSLACALATGALLASNCIYVKWSTLPYSEAGCVFWGVIAYLLYLRARSGNSSSWWIGCGIAAGIAMLTRPTAAFFVGGLGKLAIPSLAPSSPLFGVGLLITAAAFAFAAYGCQISSAGRVWMERDAPKA